MGYPPDRGHGWDLLFPVVGLHIREILCLPIWRIYGLSDVLSAVEGSLCRLHRGAPSLTGSILQRAKVKRNAKEFLKREWSSCFPLQRHRWVEWSYIIMAASLKDPHLSPRCTWLMFGPGTGSACVAALTITS